jgi:uncharacterized protein (TIGR02246 family)
VLTRVIDADNQGDLEGVLVEYTDDVIWLPPSGGSVAGKSAIRSRYQELFAGFSLSLTSLVDEVIVRGDVAIVRGRTNGMKVPRDHGPASRIDDKFLAVLRCEQRTWRVSHLMWSPRAR